MLHASLLGAPIDYCIDLLYNALCMQNIIYEKAYAKINLGLDVLGRRSDGYHMVDMVMQTIGLYDDVSVESIGDAGTLSDIPVMLLIEQDAYGEPLSSDADNLCVKAALALLSHCGRTAHFTENADTGHVLIRLHKRIPIAAGMAGGSTDAAAVFRGINRLFSFGCSDDVLRKISKDLGADIPFCISGGTVRSEGIGEILTPLRPLPAWDVLIAKPKFFVSTAEVYGEFDGIKDPGHPDIASLISAIDEQSMAKCACHIGNSLEPVTAGKYPVIREIEELMLSYGALRSVMTGSGPTVFGLFPDSATAENAAIKLSDWGMCPEIFVTTLGAYQND